MKPFTISAAFALLVAFAQAAPTPDHANITFHGADSDAGYTLSFPVDGSVITINSNLSVTQITSDDANATCIFYGSAGSVTIVVGATTEPVGPPQPQASGVCTAS